MNLKPYILLTAMALVSCNNSLESRLDRVLKPVFPADEPGAAVLVLKGDSLLYDKGFGLAQLTHCNLQNTPDAQEEQVERGAGGTRRKIGFLQSLAKNNFPESGAGIDGDTHFNIASVSKQFTAVAVLQLVQDGKVSLDDPVSKFFPEFESDIWKEIQIKHLLSHSSGVPDERGYLTREEKINGDEALATEYLKKLDHRNFAPGTAYEYINPTFVLLGQLVERVSGEEFTQYVQKHLFIPAGMDRTYYFDRNNERPDAAHGYEYADVEDMPEERTAGEQAQGPKNWYEYDFGEETFFATRPDGGIYTTTHEFVKWEKALRNGTVLNKELLQQAMSPHTKVTGSPWSDYQNRENTWYGYGWFVEPALEGAPLRIYHTGDNGGFKIMAARYPEQDLLILVFANRADWDRYGLLMQMEQIIFNS